MIDEHLDRYREVFGEAFPLMCCMDMTNAEIAAVIDECVQLGKPFEPIEGADY